MDAKSSERGGPFAECLRRPAVPTLAVLTALAGPAARLGDTRGGGARSDDAALVGTVADGRRVHAPVLRRAVRQQPLRRGARARWVAAHTARASTAARRS